MCETHYKERYVLELSAWGDGIVNAEEVSLERKLDEFRKEYGCEPDEISLEISDTKSFGLDYFYTGIDTGFLTDLKALKEIIMPDTICEISVTPELEKLLKENDVLIRGNFDSFAERFAAEYGLHFRPSDFVFARDFYEYAHETTILTLRFERSGKVYIEESVSSPGSSAGNTFGGSFYYDLPADFFRTMTAEEIAEKFRSSLYNKTIENGKLAGFIEKMKTHNVYMGEN